jgi:hypothetical protein
MACPFCSTTAPQKRPDGRCASCGKLLPEELRGGPDPLPRVSVSSSLMNSGDSIEWYDELRPGDIVVLLQLHRGRFGLKRVLGRNERNAWKISAITSRVACHQR